MKSTMKRTLGLFAAALLTMSLALSVYASGHDLTFTDKGNRMHVKDKTVHVQTYYPYEYYVLDVLEDALVVANPEWDDCGFAVCRRITNEYLDYTGSDDDFVLDYAAVSKDIDPKIIDEYRRSFQDSVDMMKDLMEAVAQNTELF